jgi:hypothetical protein
MARNKKHVNDKFYTKTEVVEKLLYHIDLSKYDLVIEPSAGDGKFYDVIKKKTGKVIGLDIDPEHPEIIKKDWFDFVLDKHYEKILVVGNPPFGNQSSLAIAFIKKCDELNVQTIAFILPKSFKKESLQNKIPLHYHLTYQVDLEDTSFILENKDYSVPSIFQIWERKEEKRNVNKKDITTELFKFVKKNENPDISFRRVGFYAGTIYDETENKAEVSHYFIKSNINIDELKSILKDLKWNHDNTAGPRSIGKRELIEKINEKLKNNIIF